MIEPRVAAHAGRLAPGQLPAYVHDLAALDRDARVIRAALPERVELYYAVKANPAPEILRALAPHVHGYEVSSGGELTHVRRVVPGSPMAFGGPGKTEEELRLALELGVERVHVESAHELRLLGALARAPLDLLLRVNLPVPDGHMDRAALAMGGRPTPFGLDPDGAASCLPLPGGGRVRLRGIHVHLASGLDARAQVAVARHITTWAGEFAGRHGFDLAEVNVGGGMAVDYARPHARFDWQAYGRGLRGLLSGHEGLTLRAEPGRSVTAYGGWYVTDVLDIKHSHGEAFAVLRGGTHHMRTPAARGHDHPFTVLPMEGWPRARPRPAVHREPVTLVGQLCTPRDVFARRIEVTALRAGDRVAFAMAGAYAWNISHHDFLMHPPPTFHYLE
ncbi:type III PLP-dependent enzyme [Streptomyces luteireticuli]|uniref:type III PLP-dependent enzyme n=1 Tax=Streptomyces luteireticuli TaxID=173858 RepID=UPI0035570639